MQTHRFETRRPVARARLAAVFGCASLASCVVVPVTTEAYDPDCRVITHHMALKVTQVQEIQNCNGSNDCALQYLAIFGVSAAVSGSIVLVGNVVYWAERRAACVAPAAEVSAS